MSTVSETNRAIVKKVAGILGGTPKVSRFWDEPHETSVDLLEASDAPQRGVTSYATIGVSDRPLLRDGEEYPVRLELVGACATRYSSYSNALTTAAFNIMKSGWFCHPGAIFPDIISMYEKDAALPHFLFVPPFLWQDALQHPIDFQGKRVAWLMAVPVSESEYEYARERGSEALEDLFVERQIDVFNLRRDPVV